MWITFLTILASLYVIVYFGAVITLGTAFMQLPPNQRRVTSVSISWGGVVLLLIASAFLLTRAIG